MDDKSREFKEGDLVDSTYQVLSRLGRGAAGSVYKVRHQAMNQIYALKALNLDGITFSAWHRFQNEARIIAQIKHPNIVTIYNFGLHENKIPFYVMDFIDGKTLREKLDESGPFAPADILPVFVQACSALAHTHKQGIIHRDIKPENLILPNAADKSALVKLVDFGIAKQSGDDQLIQGLTSKGEVFGSPFYMSPEQSLGERIDSRSDIYSLGCTLFEALCGRPPFRGRNEMDTMLLHQNNEPPKLSSYAANIPATLEEVMQKALSKAPVDRYRNMDLLGRDLDLICQGKELPINPYGSLSPEVKADEAPSKSKVGPAWLSAAAVAGLAILVTALIKINNNSDKLSPMLNKTPDNKITASEKQHYDKEIWALEDSVPANQNAGASATSSEPFSRLKNIRGQEYRVFNFPVDVTIGWIQSEDQAEATKAMGQLSFPAHAPLIFLPAPVLEQYPQFLKRFGKEEIRCLRLKEDQNSDTLLKVCSILPVKELKFYNCYELTEKSLPGLKGYRNLVLLDGSASSMSGKTLASAHILGPVKELYFSYTKDTAPLIESLKDTALERLDLSGCKLQHQDFKNLAKVSSLKILSLNDVKMSIDNLRDLAVLPNLEALEIRNNGLTREAVPVLKTFKKLRTLSTRSIEARLLKEAMPGLKIE